jgi:hypothetical protein
LPGSSKMFIYTLRPIGWNLYRGTLDVPDSCEIDYPDGRVSVLPNSFVDQTVVTVHVTGVTNGRASAYEGTLAIRSVPLAAARAHGCTIAGYQLIEFSSPA